MPTTIGIEYLSDHQPHWPTMKWNCQIHDANHLELAVDYDVQPGDQHQNLYAVNIYILTPKSLTLGKGVFGRDDLMRRFKNMSRLEPPAFDFCQRCQLPNSDRYLNLGTHMLEKLSLKELVLAEAKSFASYINGQISNARHQPESGLAMLKASRRLMANFRERYLHPMTAQAPLVDNEILAAFQLADEYMTTRYQLIKAELLTAKESPSPVGAAEDNYWQTHYRNPEQSATGREQFLNRQGYLKKYVSEILYLNGETIKRESYYKNLFAGLAAACAAIFANLARVDQRLGTTYEDAYQFYLFFGLAVIAYVFKDRIKDLAKEHLNTWFKNRLPDEEVQLTIANPLLTATPTQLPPLATVRKFYRHQKLTDIPDDIRYVRSLLQRTSQFTNTGSNVCHYRKETLPHHGMLAPLAVPRLAIKDIFRISFADFLDHFDDPRREIHTGAVQDGATKIAAAKVYYFDLMIKLQHRPKPQGQECWLAVYRLTLTREGIQRIERPLAQHHLHYWEEIGSS